MAILERQGSSVIHDESPAHTHESVRQLLAQEIWQQCIGDVQRRFALSSIPFRLWLDCSVCHLSVSRQAPSCPTVQL